MFRVSKWLYWSPPHDRIICRWRHCLPGGQNWTKKYLSHLKRYRAEIKNPKPISGTQVGLVWYVCLWWLLSTILTLNKVCLVLNLLLLKRGQRPPEGSSQGARIDGFWYLRCQNTQRNLFYMINHFQMAPMCPLRPKMELKNYSTTVNKIL